MKQRLKFYGILYGTFTLGVSLTAGALWMLFHYYITFWVLFSVFVAECLYQAFKQEMEGKIDVGKTDE